jgi:lipid A disaccharide synthetase
MRLARWFLLTAPWFALPNLVAGERVVPERLFTRRRCGRALAEEFLSVAGSPGPWSLARSRLSEVRRRLATPAVASRIALLTRADA